MLETKRNESGFIVEVNGVLPQLIDWLSQRCNFKFSIIFNDYNYLQFIKVIILIYSYNYLNDIALHTDDTKLYGRGVISFITSEVERKTDFNLLVVRIVLIVFSFMFEGS